MSYPQTKWNKSKNMKSSTTCGQCEHVPCECTCCPSLTLCFVCFCSPAAGSLPVSTVSSSGVNLTYLGAFPQSEREAEALQAGVRVDHHIRGGVVRVGVLQCGKVQVSVKGEVNSWLQVYTRCINPGGRLPSRLSRAAPKTSGTWRPGPSPVLFFAPCSCQTLKRSCDSSCSVWTLLSVSSRKWCPAHLDLWLAHTFPPSWYLKRHVTHKNSAEL